MPGWHAATKDLREQGNVRMVGIVQEQHPDRAKLFMQWKGMGWPVLVDRFNELGVTAVPITLLIDEHGVVRGNVSRSREPEEVVEQFIMQTYMPPDALSPPRERPPRDEPAVDADAAAWRRHGRWLLKWADPPDRDGAVDALRTAADLAPDDALGQFQLGVACRARYDSDARKPGDFETAVDAWSAALALDPNQYIWRRRIQQYGPRLDKPYPFYDWVPKARAAIEARGGTPTPLVVEPSGAEYAAPLREFESAAAVANPDPEGRVDRDIERLIGVETTVVPGTVEAGKSVRVHLVFRPDRDAGHPDGHWNNESGPMTVWVDAPSDWQAVPAGMELAGPAETATSDEPRSVELELLVPEGTAAGEHVVPGCALYYACAGPTGVCVYRRLDFEMKVTVE